MKHDRRKFLTAFALHGKFAHAIVAAFAWDNYSKNLDNESRRSIENGGEQSGRLQAESYRLLFGSINRSLEEKA